MHLRLEPLNTLLTLFENRQRFFDDRECCLLLNGNSRLALDRCKLLREHLSGVSPLVKGVLMGVWRSLSDFWKSRRPCCWGVLYAFTILNALPELGEQHRGFNFLHIV